VVSGAVGFHQRLEHAPPFGTGIVAIDAVVRRRLLGGETAEAGFDGADNALLDHVRWQTIECALEGITGVDLLAVDPGFAILPVDVVSQQQLVHLVDVRVVGKHDVPGHIEGESIVFDRPAPAAHPVRLLQED